MRLLKCVRPTHCAMTLGRLIYKSLLQITTQYDVSRLPLTGVVGLTEARFRYPPSRLFREAIQTRRQQPDFDGKCSRRDRSARMLRGNCFASVRYPLVFHAAGFRAIKQLQAQYYVLGGAGPVEQVWLANPYAHLRSVGTGCKGISGSHDAGFVCDLASSIIGGVRRGLLAKQGSRLTYLGKLCGCQDVEAPSSRLNEQQVLSLHAVSSTLSGSRCAQSSVLCHFV